MFDLNYIASLSRSASFAAALTGLSYSVILAGFRHSTYESLGALDTLRDLLQYATMVYLSTSLNTAIGIRLGEGKNPMAVVMLNLGITASVARICAQTYIKYVRGVKPRPVNIRGKVYVVTGCNTGIGLETAKQLAQMGGSIVMACRSPEKAAAAREEVLRAAAGAAGGAGDVVCEELDLCDLNSVRRFAQRFVASGRPLHALVNNAGVMMQSRTETFPGSGLETVFTANHLGHFLLTNLLLPHLERTGGRVVVLSSSLHRAPKAFNFGDVMSEKSYSLFGSYAQVCTWPEHSQRGEKTKCWRRSSSN